MSPDLKTHRSVISRTKFPNRSSLDAIRHHMKSIRGTGRLTVDFSQGGVNSITFEASHMLNGHDHVELLFEGSKAPAELFDGAQIARK